MYIFKILITNYFVFIINLKFTSRSFDLFGDIDINFPLFLISILFLILRNLDLDFCITVQLLKFHQQIV